MRSSAGKSVENTFRHTLERKKRQSPPTAKLMDGEQVAKPIASRLGPLHENKSYRRPIREGQGQGEVEGRYADCEKGIVVYDNLNPHTKRAVYEVFDPERARNLACRMEFHYTLNHGIWLNNAKNELSSMTRQCVAGETSTWATDLRKAQRGVNWLTKIDGVRIKLKSVHAKSNLWQNSTPKSPTSG